MLAPIQKTSEMSPLEILNERRSTPARLLGEPAPDDESLRKLLTAAIRAPDHGKLAPWRLLLIRGEARLRLGQCLAEIHAENEPDVAEALLTKDRERFSFAPVIVTVIARTKPDNPKVPVQEQILSAGCVAYNLLLGAPALGFGAQWLTGWAAYDVRVAELLGLVENERIIGFVHIGTPAESAPERNRPSLEDILGEWKG